MALSHGGYITPLLLGCYTTGKLSLSGDLSKLKAIAKDGKGGESDDGGSSFKAGSYTEHEESLAQAAAKPLAKRCTWARSSISTKLLAAAQGMAADEKEEKPKTLAQRLLEEDKKESEGAKL